MVKKSKTTTKKKGLTFDAFGEKRKSEKLYGGHKDRRFLGLKADSLEMVRSFVSEVDKDDEYAEWHANLTFSDGYAGISFDFGSWQEEDQWDNSIEKIHDLIRFLEEFKDEMAAAQEVCRVKQEMNKG